MSIITNAQPVPNRVRMLWKFLLDRGADGVSEQSVSGLFSPSSLQGEGDVSTLFPNTLNECLQLGLIYREESDSGTVLKLSGYPDCHESDWKDVFIRHIERMVFDEDKNVERGQKWVPFAFSWLLEQLPAKPLSWGMNPNPQITSEYGIDSEAFGLSNDAAFNTFAYWAHFLGFCSRIKVAGKRCVIPDPTEAIARHLTSVFHKDSRLPGAEFVQKIGEICPVLETGVFRERLNQLASGDSNWGASNLSHSTCLALERLRQRGIVSFEVADDAPTVSLATPVNDKLTFTHIRYQGDSGAVH